MAPLCVRFLDHTQQHTTVGRTPLDELPWLRFSFTLTDEFPCFFLSCKENARVKLAKTGHGPHSCTLVVICVVLLLFVLFCVLFVCKCVLYYCHRVATQLQLTNISIIRFPDQLVTLLILKDLYILNHAYNNKFILYIFVYTTYYLIYSMYEMRTHLIHRKCAVCVKLPTEWKLRYL